MNKLEVANKIAKEFNGRIWSPKGETGIVRVYIGDKGYCQIDDDLVNTNSLNGHNFQAVKDFLVANDIANKRRA